MPGSENSTYSPKANKIIKQPKMNLLKKYNEKPKGQNYQV